MRIKVTTVETELEFEIPDKSPGKKLFELVSRNVGIHELWFFGIFFSDVDDHNVWIDDSKKILRNFKTVARQFKYRVKYFPEDVSNELLEESTTRYFFLQVRSCILSDNLYCPPDTCVLLASYASQARHGDYDHVLHQNVLSKEKILPERVITQHNTESKFWEENIINMWKKHRGMIKEEAMMEYLKLCQNLEMFGVHYFEIYNTKGTRLLLGVYSLGLNIYTVEDKMNPKIMFPWSEIKNINFRDKKFTIKPTDKTAKNFVFLVQKPRINKRILKLGIGYHQQYVRKRKPESMEIIQMRAKADARRQLINQQRVKLQEEILAREQAEKREADYKKQIAVLKEQVNEAHQKYLEAQAIIQKLKEKLLELEKAKNELESKQNELQSMMQKLERSKNMEAEEKQKLEDEIRRRQADVERIRSEVNIKDSETRRLQEEVEEARRKEEELKAKQQAEAARLEEEKQKELLAIQDKLPELTAVNEELRDQLKVLKEQLEKSRDETKETDMDKIHRKNVKDGKDKYQTLAAIRKGNTTRRVDLFENL